ncbi:S-(hydroxymethyl)glutathione dehydrogenase / alcohol dehydrogenase [Actinacidiphila alni]|uniref:S-(Hydroxymethyl)glutathione dehydrogenase / alcohol dehydrogenase n=1 Tax=Actinacidiphila alni TaxID=380248 RepID=A0A1I2HQU5_9ACTN|nr:Zn-dependent alcohol dehydrogenase [Actinacidiphila alni]SFF32494.1 S-(hydroxymethyl)glutathione dehydrogenase / alcohol dehydrogenase [Actinacidiphila alni]
MVRAAVLPAVNAPLTVADIDLPEPGPGQVRVRLAAAGVCHSDLSLSNGTLRQPAPAVLGHEGAGTVVSVGEGVDRLAPGDRVVLNWAPACGECHFCGLGEPWLCANSGTAAGRPYAALAADGSALHPGLGTAAFAEETVVAASAALPLPDGVPLTDAALLGCAVLTGYGAVHHAARIMPGETVAVFGVGGVGLAVLQSARIAGAGRIVAVDVAPAKEELALAAGATDFVVAGEDTAKRIRALSGGFGTDAAIECVGRADTIRTAWSATRRGGRTTVVGIGGQDQQVTFSALELFYFGRTLSGCVYGNCDPAKDLPVLAEHVRAGRLDLSAMVTDRITLDGIPAAFEAMTAGRGGRALVVF